MSSEGRAPWVGRAIQAARRRSNLTQGELAQRLGRTQASISAWESGKRIPGLEELFELADILSCEVEDFLPRRDRRQPAGMLLRATAARLDATGLEDAVDRLLGIAESRPTLPAELRVSARQPAAAANELLEKANVVEPKVDVVELIGRCGVLYLEESMPDSLSGLVFETDGGAAVVGVNEDHHPKRRRFSAAHELGHYLLKHHEQDGVAVTRGPHIDTDEGLATNYDWRAERSANEFAAALLMPRSMVTRIAEQTTAPRELAHIFEVSELAMGYRLLDLGIR